MPPCPQGSRVGLFPTVRWVTLQALAGEEVLAQPACDGDLARTISIIS